ncbi:ABC transporter permease [Castellaniella sp. GW247-6E4]|uniref:ABC transporter permease n=1 Tax=Castellaniella sp. GW247-6E4 TaxID=3140380 RepID=UPI0033149C86
MKRKVLAKRLSHSGQIVLSLVLAAVIWEVMGRFVVVSPLLFVPLSEVIARGIELWEAGELQLHVWISFIEFLGGYSLAALVGILLGGLLGSSMRLRTLFEPWVSMLYSTPVIALGPLFILWLGIGVGSKVAIIFLTSVFPILINTSIGLVTTDKTLLEVARSCGATGLQLFWKVRMPSAIPYVIGGLRLGVARALVGVVVAELFGARAGIGFMIMNSTQSFDTASLYVGVLILAVAGVTSVGLLKLLEEKITPWRMTGEDE